MGSLPMAQTSTGMSACRHLPSQSRGFCPTCSAAIGQQWGAKRAGGGRKQPQRGLRLQSSRTRAGGRIAAWSQIVGSDYARSDCRHRPAVASRRLAASRRRLAPVSRRSRQRNAWPPIFRWSFQLQVQRPPPPDRYSTGRVDCSSIDIIRGGGGGAPGVGRGGHWRLSQHHRRPGRLSAGLRSAPTRTHQVSLSTPSPRAQCSAATVSCRAL
mmetsp:Transcript_775/g.1895  ORF Transcript_775/g.1895 Transcript_775/m.1895 type:complete len:212 (+) Transcript_775:432-1067(+)